MKKLTFVACAAMLASAVALTGCQGDNNAPTQQGVTTDIAISLPGQVGASGPNKMPGATPVVRTRCRVPPFNSAVTAISRPTVW